MTSTIKRWILTIALANALFPLSLAFGQQEEVDQPQPPIQVTPVAPVPSSITNGKKVFISNAGLDMPSLDLFKRLGEPDRPYNQFYAAVKSWGRFEVVSAPADADLVFEFQATAPVASCIGHATCQNLQFGLTILDTKTHFTLWNLIEPIGGAWRRQTFVKNVNQAMDNLMADLKKLAAQPTTAAGGGQ
jgi:hypothetical protein